ncbi:Sulfatase [Pseudobythopirellula maris]|uniref:Sulfatase n=1 Tax=Pseudobythopirellula maris TaxID=2527991 RepID=A0A5C5ZQA2_9BACT|nr:hypothetical protein [Pseudobythopirellula maris]TWT89702.1 Sulfatase [Pseudobythopirellula maris]
MPPTPANLIVLLVDGLRASALGAYGNTTFGTPALDRLAAQSELCEWCYADTPDHETLLGALWGGAKGESLAAVAHRMGLKSMYVTDDRPAATIADQCGFGSVEWIEPASPSRPADSIAGCWQAEFWRACAERLEHAAPKTPSDTPLMLIAHTAGLYGAWDAPAELVESLVDEEDPPVEVSVDRPDQQADGEDADAAADARFAASCRYAAQVMALDACIEGFLEVVDRLLAGSDATVAIVGLRGFPLGEHGIIGGVDERLFGEQQHVPVLLRRSGANARGLLRDDKPSTLSDLGASLLASGVDATAGGVARLSSPSGAVAIRTDEWYFRHPGGEVGQAGEEVCELYVKPDDRWEANDIASLRGEVVEDFVESLASGAAVGPRKASPVEPA